MCWCPCPKSCCLITRRSHVRVALPLVEGSLRNPPTRRLSRNARAETPGRSRSYASLRKKLRPSLLDVVVASVSLATANLRAASNVVRRIGGSLGVSGRNRLAGYKGSSIRCGECNCGSLTPSSEQHRGKKNGESTPWRRALGFRSAQLSMSMEPTIVHEQLSKALGGVDRPTPQP